MSRESATELFRVTYSKTHQAADLASDMAHDGLTRKSSERLLWLLREAAAAAQELDNRMAGNAPPKMG
jgi:hypothetical protein